MGLSGLVGGLSLYVVGLRAARAYARAIADLDLNRRLRTLEVDVAEQADEVGKMVKLVTKISRRQSVAKAREKRHEPEPEQTETDDEWKARMNRELAQRQTRMN